jgi:hypothetical protein
MSRPRMPENERKSVRVLVRLTPEQAKKTREMCEAEGLPGVSALLRQILVSALASSAA